MRIVGQLGRLLPGSDEKLDGNAYLGLLALMGLIGWGVTAYVVHFIQPPPKGVVKLAEIGPWAEAVAQYSWDLIWLWVGLFVALFLVSAFRFERGAFLSIPSIMWGLGMVAALAVNAAALHYSVREFVWMPWFVLYAVGYLVTGVLVERGWIYLLAGAVSTVLAANGVYGYFTNTGCTVVTLNPVVETPLAGAVMFPMPLTYVVLGILHVVPLAVDALMGGRQMTEEGIPKVKADRMDDGGDEEEEVGGVVTN